MPESSRRIQLDGLRGYAAIAVVVFHSILDRDPTLNARIVRPSISELSGGYDLWSKAVLMLFNGEAAVVLFFVLSGTVLCQSLLQREAAPTFTAAGFTIRRFLRLYPAFFVALGGCFAAFASVGAYEFAHQHFWANARLSDFSLLGASWTLQVECLAIPFVLVSYWAMRRFGALGVLGSYAAFMLFLNRGDTHSPLWNFQRFLSCFAIGALVPSRLGAAVVRTLPLYACPFLFVGMLTIRHLLGLHWWSMDVMQLIAGLLVAQLFYSQAGRFGMFFASRVSQYLCRISYSIYLFSVVYLILFEHWLAHFPTISRHPIEAGILSALPIVAATILTAHIAERLFERPFIRLGHKLTRFSNVDDPRLGVVAR